jgi:triosephosphate isomerase
MKKKIIIGNWKMNPVTIEDAKSIFKATKSAAEKSKSLDVIVCPPFVYLSTVLKTESESVCSMIRRQQQFLKMKKARQQ